MVRPRPSRVWTSLLAGLTLSLTACQDSQVTPVELTPNFDIAEARSGGNLDFFFAPPLAATPQPGDAGFDEGAANALLVPSVRICIADTNATTEAGCLEDVTLEQTGFPNGLILTFEGGSELYKVNWQTKSLHPDTAYRIEVWGLVLANEGERTTVDSRWLFGWRDIANSPSTASCDGSESVCLVNYGQNIPIKVRIEQFVFCPLARNCAVQFVAAGSTANLEALLDPTAGASSSQLFIPGQQGTDFALAFEPCSLEEEADVDAAVDIPTFGPCLKTVTSFTGQLSEPAIVSLCETINTSSFDLADPDTQLEQIALHHFHESGEPMGQLRVEALPEAHQCTTPTSGGMAWAHSTNWLQQFAQGVREKAVAWVAPRSVHAAAVVLDRGGGGSTGFINSFFKLALPAKFERGSPANQTKPAGSDVPLTARVTDLLGGPVKNARVHWSVNSSPVPAATIVSTVPILTTASGEASATVRLSTTQGDNVFHASGRGIADDRTSGCTTSTSGAGAASCNGPRDASFTFGAFDPFMPFNSALFDAGEATPSQEVAVELASGTFLSFTVFGCTPGRGTATVDGMMAAGEWDCARSRDFTANISGGSGFPASLFWMNDGQNLYLAVRVTGTDRTNSLRFDFDNDGNAGPETVVSLAAENDDVLEFNPPSTFKDRYLTAKCTNSSQSSCGNDDPIQDGSGAFRNDQSGFTVYEMIHPLSTNQVVDFSRTPNDPLGLFVTLRLGNGAQGNTQWPGFRKYLKITIAP